MATLQQLDMNILLWIQEHLRVDALTPFWRAVTFLGNGGWFWIVLCVLLICFGKTRKTGVTAALSLLSGFLITNLLIKNAVARPRPFDTYTQIIPLITRPKDYSFPSGHTTAAMAFGSFSGLERLIVMSRVPYFVSTVHLRSLAIRYLRI